MIREADEKDFFEIAKIYNHYLRSTVITFEEVGLDSVEVKSRISKVASSGLWWLVAEEDNHIAGYAYASKWHERPAYRKTVEATIYLNPGSVGKGLGSALYKQLLKLLKSKGFHVAIGCIALPNEASVKLHEKLGFKKVAHFEELGFKFGKWVDVGYWQVNLNA